jgi:hypothetical protein
MLNDTPEKPLHPLERTIDRLLDLSNKTNACLSASFREAITVIGAAKKNGGAASINPTMSENASATFSTCANHLLFTSIIVGSRSDGSMVVGIGPRAISGMKFGRFPDFIYDSLFIQTRLAYIQNGFRDEHNFGALIAMWAAQAQAEENANGGIAIITPGLFEEYIVELETRKASNIMDVASGKVRPIYKWKNGVRIQ